MRFFLGDRASRFYAFAAVQAKLLLLPLRGFGARQQIIASGGCAAEPLKAAAAAQGQPTF